MGTSCSLSTLLFPKTRLVDAETHLEGSFARETAHWALDEAREKKLEWFRRSPPLNSRSGLECLDSVARQPSTTGERPPVFEPQTDFSGCSLRPEATFVVIRAVSHKKQEQMPSPKGGGEVVNVCLPQPPAGCCLALVEVN